MSSFEVIYIFHHVVVESFSMNMFSDWWLLYGQWYFPSCCCWIGDCSDLCAFQGPALNSGQMTSKSPSLAASSSTSSSSTSSPTSPSIIVIMICSCLSWHSLGSKLMMLAVGFVKRYLLYHHQPTTYYIFFTSCQKTLQTINKTWCLFINRGKGFTKVHHD